MTRRIFAGPIVSINGIETGIGEERKVLVDKDGDIASIGSADKPATVTGYVKFLVSNEESVEALPAIGEGQFAIFLMASDNSLVLKTSDGVVGTIDITAYVPPQ